MLMVSKRSNTYTDWATEIGLIEGRTISKQALHERMRPQTEMFVQDVVKELISRQVSINPSHKLKGVLSQFGNEIIDDSTTISLPDVLSYLKAGDLCLRDLAFTILDVVSGFVEKGIYTHSWQICYCKDA